MSRRDRNRRAIARYVEHVRHARYPGTAGSVVDTLQFTGKPESSAPHTATGERHLDHPTNAEARRVIEPVIEGYLRRRYSDSYWLLEAAPTQARSWCSGANTEALETAWRYARAIAEVEEEIERRNPGVEIAMSVSPHEEPLVKEGAPHHRHRRIGVEDSYRKRYDKLRCLEEREDITRSAAVEMVAKEEAVSPATIWRCVEFCEEEAS